MLKVKFDQKGNVIPQVVNYPIKHDDLTNDLINEATEKYFCSQCNRIHKKFIKHRASKIFIKHQKYAIECSNDKLWRLKLAKSIDKYDIKAHKRAVGSRKQ